MIRSISDRMYAAITNICVAVAIVCALVYDKLEAARPIAIAFGIAAAVVAVVFYFLTQWAQDTLDGEVKSASLKDEEVGEQKDAKSEKSDWLHSLPALEYARYALHYSRERNAADLSNLEKYITELSREVDAKQSGTVNVSVHVAMLEKQLELLKAHEDLRRKADWFYKVEKYQRPFHKQSARTAKRPAEVISLLNWDTSKEVAQ